jgi:hypothetical protein
VRTVGVDIAKSHKTTALCAIRWSHEGAHVEAPVLRATDAMVLEAARATDVAAIALDAPLGWPMSMVAAIAAWRPDGRWERPADHAFRLRRTDAFTAARTKCPARDKLQQGHVERVRAAVPLSVSADKIAMVAWRCCALLSDLTQGSGARHNVVTDAIGRPFPRDGRVSIVEAYPAAALSMWAIPRDGYKDAAPEGKRVRASMLSAIEGAGVEGWLRLSDEARDACVATDHAFDAMVCALVARAAMLGLVAEVPPDDAEHARTEGWIALPHPDSLARLSSRDSTAALPRTRRSAS